MYAESRARAVRVGVVAEIVRTVNGDNRHIRRVATVRANGLIPKEFIFALLFERELIVNLSLSALALASRATVVTRPCRALLSLIGKVSAYHALSQRKTRPLLLNASCALLVAFHQTGTMRKHAQPHVLGFQRDQ